MFNRHIISLLFLISNSAKSHTFGIAVILKRAKKGRKKSRKSALSKKKSLTGFNFGA
jgi:hypothetical protein